MAKAGFTLIEVLFVIALFSFLAVSFFTFDIPLYRGTSFDTEIDSLATALIQARDDALLNRNELPHGVFVQPNAYVIFEGQSFEDANHARDISIPSRYGLIFSTSSPDQIVFEQLSGELIRGGTITMTDPNRLITRSIEINNAGRIDW